MLLRIPLVALITLVVGLSAAFAKEAGNAPWLKFTLNKDEQAAIAKYYQQHARPQTQDSGKKQKQLPPGLKKKLERGGELPPGWQKKVARGEVMDPVLYKQAKPIPADLIKILPPQPKGTTIVVVEGKAVRLWEATRTIIDVLDL